MVQSIYSMFLYLFRYRRNIEHLKYEVRDGKEIGDEVWQYTIEALQRGNNNGYTKAHIWLQNLEQKLYASKKTLEGAGEGENAGYINRRSPNIISRYRLSKKAYKLAQDMAKFIDSDEANSFRVTDIPSKKVVVTKAILKALEDNVVSKIGLYGIASSRMTAILMNAAIKACEKGLFDEVVWVIMPHNLNLMVIQSELANILGLKLNNIHDDTDNSECLEENAKLVNERLIGSIKTLVIFDDVHQHFSLSEIGIWDGGNCKIVITSREEKMCNEMGCQKNMDMQAYVSKIWSDFKDKEDWQEKASMDSIVKELVEDCETFSYGPGKEIDLQMMRVTKVSCLELTRQRKIMTPHIFKEVKRKIDIIMQPTAAANTI